MDKLNNEGVIRKAACDVFKEIDSDGNGKIDPGELKDAMSKMGVKLTAKEVDRMMIEADQDGFVRTGSARTRSQRSLSDDACVP